MKKLMVFSVLFFSFALISCNHTKTISTDSIPKNVLATFTVMFPKARNIEWHRVSDFIYQSDFWINKDEMTARFNLNGIWQRTTKIIHKVDLPSKVVEALNMHYKEVKITKVSTVTDPSIKVYVIDIKKNGHKIQLSYDRNGSLMSHILN